MLCTVPAHSNLNQHSYTLAVCSLYDITNQLNRRQNFDYSEKQTILWGSDTTWDWRLTEFQFLSRSHGLIWTINTVAPHWGLWQNTDYSTNCDWHKFLCSLIKTPSKELSVFGSKSRETETFFFIFFLIQRFLSNNARPPAVSWRNTHLHVKYTKQRAQQNANATAHFPDSFTYLSGCEIMEAGGRQRPGLRSGPLISRTLNCPVPSQISGHSHNEECGRKE